MNGIEQIRYYYNQLPFSTVLLNKITVDLSRSIFEKLIASPNYSADSRMEMITSSKLQKYLVYYDFEEALPDNPEDSEVVHHKGLIFLHKAFSGREYSELSVDEKNCLAVLTSALEDRFEKYDGSGYPMGKSKDEICPLAQILSVSEHIANSRLECVNEISIVDSLNEKSGVDFSPEIVDLAKFAVTEMFDADRKWFAIYGSDDSDNGALQMEYQPIIDCEKGETCGYENRMVLRDKNLDPMLPAVYVPIAEKSNRINAITELQLEKICLRMAQNRLDPSGKVYPVWVNVSSVCLKRKSFVQLVKKLLTKYHIDPEKIILEITETAFGYEDCQISATVSELRKLGIRVALDHFGTEYSSLSGLGNLEIDIIKIDEGFADSIIGNQKTEEIVKSIILLAQNLKVKVVATGVDTGARKDILADLSCKYMQGEEFGSWDCM